MIRYLLGVVTGVLLVLIVQEVVWMHVQTVRSAVEVQRIESFLQQITSR